MYQVIPGQPITEVKPGQDVIDAIDKLATIFVANADIRNKQALTAETKRLNEQNAKRDMVYNSLALSNQSAASAWPTVKSLYKDAAREYVSASDEEKANVVAKYSDILAKHGDINGAKRLEDITGSLSKLGAKPQDPYGLLDKDWDELSTNDKMEYNRIAKSLNDWEDKASDIFDTKIESFQPEITNDLQQYYYGIHLDKFNNGLNAPPQTAPQQQVVPSGVTPPVIQPVGKLFIPGTNDVVEQQPRPIQITKIAEQVVTQNQASGPATGRTYEEWQGIINRGQWTNEDLAFRNIESYRARGFWNLNGQNVYTPPAGYDKFYGGMK